MYELLLKPLLFTLPPERAHYTATAALQRLCSYRLLAQAVEKIYSVRHPSLERTLFGLRFPNPVGLAAGFDKDARWIEPLARLGFGFVEVGTITPKPQPGNEAPRLFRLKSDHALINRMGFNNAGADSSYGRLHDKEHRIPVGINLGKNKITPNEQAASDYRISFERLYDCGDYFVVNVSSPNTPGLRALQGKDELAKIFDELNEVRATRQLRKPVLLKIAPDLENEQLTQIAALVTEMQVDGIVATNTTLKRDNLKAGVKLANEVGGLSGPPVAQRSTAVIRFLRREAGLTVPIIGVGGIDSPAQALAKFEAGADLIQLYTGFIYHGPALVKAINKNLVSYDHR